MVVIGKGSSKLKVTASAYKNFYKHCGWVVKQGSVQTQSVKDDEVSDEEWDEVTGEDEPTKPLSEMNRAELEDMAKDLGVSLAGLSTNKQIREAIKAAM